MPFKFVLGQTHFEGTVLDFEKGRPLAGVTVLAGKNYAFSDSSGYFKVKILPSTKEIEFIFLSYATLVVNPTENKSKKFYLKALENQIKEVTVIADDANKSVLTQISGLQSLDKKDLEMSVGFMGQKDPLKAISSLPGVGNGGEGNAGLYIRGGTSGQNLTLLNDAVIYNPAHLLGLFSVFNPAVISQLNLYKNGSPANHPGRLSGVVELKTDKTVTESLKVEADMSLFSLNLNAEIPIRKNWSIGVYGRKTFFNQTVWPLLEKLGESSFFKKVGYDFYDLNLISNAKISKKSNLQVSFYKGGDDFGFSLNNYAIKNDMDWTNTASSATLTTFLSNKVVLHTTASFSAYDFNFGIDQDEYKAGINSNIADISVKQSVNIYTKNHQLKAGLQFTNHQFKPNTPFSQSFGTPLTYAQANTYYADDFAIFFTDEYKVSDKLTFNGGLRLNHFRNKGPYEKANVDGSFTSYPTGKTVSKQLFISPSFSANYALSGSSAFKTSFSYNVQPVHLISITAVNFPADFWMPAINNIKPASAWQGSLGYFKDFKDKKFNFFIEAYYKQMQNLVEFSGGIVNLIDNLKIEDNLLIGKGNSYGTEVFFKKNTGKLRGSLSYTLSFSDRQFPQINNGNKFPFKYDRRHNLVIATNYQAGKNWMIGTNFSLASGSAFTMPVSRYLISGNVVNEYGAYNGSKMPIFHRLDFSATRELRKSEKFESSLTFSVYNLYSRQNPIYTFFLAEGDLESQRVAISQKNVSLLPILPAINYRIKFK
ncbi:MAG TPA: TonB-dependent receptor [Pelobium sp.]|nr:TonB-dependent receptor [Pelobium sp.]